MNTATATIVADQTEIHDSQGTPPDSAPSKLRWNGEVPIQKWMNFYTKVLAKFATGTDLKVKVAFEVTRDTAIGDQKAEETKTALRELGLDDTIES